MNARVIILLAACLTSLRSEAQTKKVNKLDNGNAIKVLASAKKDSVLLRWAPVNELTWQLGNKYGYTIERYTIVRDGKLVTDAEKHPVLLTSVPVKPLPENAWDNVIAQDKRAAGVLKILYSHEFDKATADGGIQDFLKKKQELEMRFSLALFSCDVSPVTAKAAGLLFADTKVQTNGKYAYKISLAQIPQGIYVEPGIVMVTPSEVTRLLKPANLSAVFSDSIVRLSWSGEMYTGTYVAWDIERSTDGKNFRSATNGLPYVQASKDDDTKIIYFKDSLADNTHTYWYRITGITPFGERGPGSAVVQGKGRPAFSRIPTIEKAENQNNKAVVLQWKFPQDALNDITGFAILRANKSNGPYTEITKQLLSKNKFTYTDKTPELTNYYKVQAIGKEPGLMSLSFPYLAILEDDKNLDMPQGVHGLSNDSGMVKLHWKANTDKDLLGYRVFRANSLQEEFTDIHNAVIKDTIYVDTIAVYSLTPQVYYKIVAVDKRYNTSPYSAPCLVKRPDKIPPAKPLFTKVQIDKDTIVLQWIPSSSEDVVAYRLSRINTVTKDSVLIKAWNNNTFTSYKDTSLRQGYTYRYNLQAIDSVGNIAATGSGDLFFESGLRKAVTDVTATVDKQKKSIKLQWKYAEPNVKQYLLYRSVNNQPMLLAEALTGTTTSFEDKHVAIGNTYTYRIKAVLPKSVNSKMEKGVDVKY